MKNIKNLLRNKKIQGGGLLLLLINLFIIGIGFSSWQVSSDEISKEIDNSINVSDSQEEIENINLKFDKEINKSEFLASTDLSGTNSHYIDKLAAKLTYKNNNSNSKYTGKLGDYFEMYDPYYPASENSPYLENEESQQNLYFENHYEEDESIESTMYYQQNYTLVDTTKTSFDSTKVDIILESIKSLLNPENGNGVTIQEMSMTAVSGLSVPNYLKFFASKVKTSDTAYQFRYHILFYAKGSSDIKIASSHIDSTATHIKTSDVSFPSGEVTAINIKTTKREGNSSITFTSKFEDDSKSVIISFPTCFEANAGYDRDYDVIDITRNKDSFASYKTKMLSYIQNISFNVTPIIANSTVEILSEDDEESNLKNHNLPFIYAYVSRY